MRPEIGPGYDVEHVDGTNRCQVIGSDLTLEEAVAMAREEAQRRGLGRMFRAGSTELRNVIVISERSPGS